MIAVFATGYKQIICKVSTNEVFYIGYGFAMFHRLIGYNVLKFRSMVVLYIISAAIKYSILPGISTDLLIIIIFLELSTVALSYKSERVERDLFDVLYKSKKDSLKFKNLLSQHLPNQMTILSRDTKATYYINNSFKQSFGCPYITQVKQVMQRCLVDKDGLKDSKLLSKSFEKGFKGASELEDMDLYSFLGLLAKEYNILQENEIINISVKLNNDDMLITEEKFLFQETEQDKSEIISPKRPGDLLRNSLFNPRNSIMPPKFDDAFVISPTTIRQPRQSKRESKAMNIAENQKLFLKNSIGTHVAEEEPKQIFKVKIFLLEWDNKEALAVIFDDITQQKIISDLQTADKNKDMILSTVSHELRTPINGVLGLLDIAKKKIHDTNTLSYLQACKNSGLLMLNLVNSILDINRIKQNKLKLEYTQVNVEELLQEIKFLFDYQRLMKNLIFDIEIATDVPKSIITDRNRLSQVLVNLLGNAFKFTFNPSTGNISFKR